VSVVEPEPYAGFFRHPGEQLGSPMLKYVPARPAVTDRRGNIRHAAIEAHVVLCGPLGGQLACTPARLRYEGHRLLDAAATLQALIDREPVADVEGQGMLL
jgi:hypothetical protein